MRKRVLFGLMVLNVILAAAILMGPVAAQVLPMSSLRDCCQGTVCCENCCWFRSDCDLDSDCFELNLQGS